LFGLAAACGCPAQEAAMPIRNLRLPLEHYEDGTVKTQLRAGVALVPPQGIVTASNVVVELFLPDGSVDVRLDAEDCRFDREQGRVDSENRVKVTRAGVELSGKGFIWQREKQRVKILSRARVAFQRDLKKTRGSLTARLGRSRKKQ
jgi:hypothetical protein